MDRSVWVIVNHEFELIIDGEIKDDKVVDKKFSPGSDIWTNEIPKLKFEDEKIQHNYDKFISNIFTFFLEPQANQVLIDAKIGEESEYRDAIVIRKIEEYVVDKII